MRILFIGDIVAKLGREALKEVLPSLLKEEKIDLCIANIENLSHGKGATQETIDEIRKYGVDLMTSGNHIWYKEEIKDILKEDKTVIRPANYSAEAAGFGFTYASAGKEKVLVINLLGRQWMGGPIDNPFKTVEAILAKEVKKEKPNVILVDFHAEATSEKTAMGWFLDGEVTAVVGTHTHVPTADQWIMPQGTAYVTDLGMTGAQYSVLGVEPDIIVGTFLNPEPSRFEWVEEGPKLFRSVLIETGKGLKAKSIKRIDKLV